MGKKRVAYKTGEAQQTKSRSGAYRISKKLSRGIAHIRATYNNTMITITDEKGDVVAWSSAGALGYSGAKKSTPFVAARVAEDIAQKLSRTGLKDISVLVKGVGSGRDSAIRALANHGFNILSIKDVTPLPHNGPRPPKPRRV